MDVNSPEERFSTDINSKLTELKSEQFSYRFIMAIGVVGLLAGLWMASKSGTSFYDNYQFDQNSLTTKARIDQFYDPDSKLFFNTRGATKARQLGVYIAEVRYRVNNDQDLILTNVITRSIDVWAKNNDPAFFDYYAYATIRYLPDEPRKARFDGDTSFKYLGWNYLVWSAVWFIIGGGGVWFARSGINRINVDIHKWEKKKTRHTKDGSGSKSTTVPKVTSSDQMPTQVISGDTMPTQVLDSKNPGELPEEYKSIHEMRTQELHRRSTGEDEPEL